MFIIHIAREKSIGQYWSGEGVDSLIKDAVYYTPAHKGIVIIILAALPKSLFVVPAP
jgi:hypothetical protein